MQQQKNNLILLAIIILGFALGYMYNIYFSNPYSLVPAQVSNKINATKLSTMIDNIKWDIVNKESFNSLESFGEIPVVPGQTGKRDIFSSN